ncbi:11-beta-hydroxysteroid dehydrogenase 1B-like [Chenopodium quinoa]|uniref:11-beta-hydroxysteroid dehydrogenase 1B-like n=1 Tax=Chenopodium quinoa TaxID=63459 RepID=UPI000B77221F|nr:11-beta-hydroxysteroid dehydrogenase 1B-like [Chenopodium quinoa]
MNLINEILNIGAPPFIFFSLCFFLPLFQFLKFSVSILSSIYAEDVAGKVVIITGASSGIGEQLAYEYARRGACLVLAARREQSLRDVAYMCLELGSPDSITVTADVSIVDDCKRIVDSTISHFGRVDHLVNNAGITSISMIEDYEDIIIPTSIMDINFWGAVYVTHFAIPHLRKTEGKIIVMSSSAARLPTPRMSIYNASKAAMIAFYETLRVELGSDIQITIATPGFVESEMTKGKHLAPEGLMNVDVNLRDVQVSALPIITGQRCAKAIINSACRGDRYVTEPTWYKVFSWWKAFTPELLDWFFSAFYLIKIGDSSFNSLSKMILDLPGLRAMVYPSSVYSPGVKTK